MNFPQKSINKEQAQNQNMAKSQIGGIIPLRQLEIKEVTGHNLESQGREIVNDLLKKGWILLHIYTLIYREDGVWRERPMAILGKPKRKRK